MLSRVANSVFWMSRYIERFENRPVPQPLLSRQYGGAEALAALDAIYTSTAS